MTEVTTVTGDKITVDTSLHEGFGFAGGQIVHFTKSLRNGKVALIRGVYDNMIWFSVFPNAAAAAEPSALEAPVDTVSSRCKEELLRQYGWVPDDLTNPGAA